VVHPENTRNPGIFILLGRSTGEVDGTRILLCGYKPDPESVKKMVRFWNDELENRLIAEQKFSSADCPKDMPSAIFDSPDLLYIRNMHVGEMSRVLKRKSLLSYDLWWVRLDVSRKMMTQSAPQLFLEIVRLLEFSEEARRKCPEELVAYPDWKAPVPIHNFVMTNRSSFIEECRELRLRHHETC
jgi:hypothetical protein